MNGVRLIICYLFFFNFKILAQHCPWDYSRIVVLRAIGPTQTLIPNLKITVLDSNDHAVMTNIWNGKDWLNDTLRMEQNPAKTTHKGYIDNQHPVKPGSIRFWFAEDNYVLVSDLGKNAKFKLKIEDIDGEKNGGKFLNAIVNVKAEDIYPLCNHFSDWDLGPGHGFVKGYAPIQVALQMKK